MDKKEEHWDDNMPQVWKDFVLLAIWFLNLILTGLYYLLYPIMKWHEKKMKEKHRNEKINRS